MAVPLWIKSNYSFLEGVSHPEELVIAAAEHGLPALALTDRDGVYGIVRAHVRARDLGIKLIVGAQMTVSGRPVVVLARGQRGYAQLCQLISLARAQGGAGAAVPATAPPPAWATAAPPPTPPAVASAKNGALTAAQLAAAGDDLLVLCPDAALLAPLARGHAGRIYALVARHLVAEDRHQETQLRAAAKRLGVPLVAATEVLYHHPSRRPLQDIVTCVRHGVDLAGAGRLLRPNAEHGLPTAATMQRRFADLPEALTATFVVADACSFDLGALRYRYPSEHLPDGKSGDAWLRELTFAGAARRYGEGVAAIAAQLDRELALIAELDYGGYFLTMHEVVAFCRSRGILCQGRGSAANSAVCYCLGITAVDPVQMTLLFERFLSRERAEPPDIDLDIEHQRREEVIQWVYERYGRRHAAMVANTVRYRMRSAVRDVGRALGVAPTATDRLAQLSDSHGERLDAAMVAAVGLGTVGDQLMKWVHALLDFPRHQSIHPGGFLLGHAPVDTLVPIEPATMPGRTVIQWDKQDVEDLGLFKVDLLGLGALTHVRRAFALIEATGGPRYEMATVPREDPATYAMLSRGDSVGVFQVESRAQMAMLPRLKPRTFYDLVVEVAIVRPGPIQGDMVHPYLARREAVAAGAAPLAAPHPRLEAILRRTFGVPIFQEQVMQIAIATAGYSPGEADQLRRDMGAWRSHGRIEAHHARLTGRMVAAGVPADFAERLFAQIRGFGEYGFPESHAASFAYIVYVTAWLRCHHRAAFTCALLNSQPMGFYSPATLVADAQRHGVVVRPIDVNHSAWDCTLERAEPAVRGRAHPAAPGRAEPAVRGRAHPAAPEPVVAGAPERDEPRAPEPAVRMGLRYIKGLSAAEGARLVAAARPFASLADLVAADLGQGTLLRLAEAGALASLGLDRRAALWAVRGLPVGAGDSLPCPGAEPLPELAPLAPAEAVLWDVRASHHSTRGHVLSGARRSLTRQRLPTARAVAALRHGSRCRYVGQVICRQRPQTASGVCFLTLEDETGLVNVVLWRQIFAQYGVLARAASVLGVRGKIESAHGVVHLLADHLFRPQLQLDLLPLPSRDFH